ncbi:hypothetical protein CHARACLAT_026823 [Characodon lateralis]|uniref:Uncharacterized protein n=1 Tax=Characodon lateralis TaxID=208331 RepID=A0ABU7DKJ0_9TELE|nr:hypothetical protein [Characodon lateralis]
MIMKSWVPYANVSLTLCRISEGCFGHFCTFAIHRYNSTLSNVHTHTPLFLVQSTGESLNTTVGPDKSPSDWIAVYLFTMGNLTSVGKACNSDCCLGREEGLVLVEG